MTEERIQKLYLIAENNLDNIIESWWYEIGSWDGLLEDEDLTMEELNWIWNNVKVQGVVE